LPNWVPIAELSACPPGKGLEAVAGDRIVAVYNVDGEIFALDGVCSHQGGPLGKGKLNGCVVACPWHGWTFDVKTGQHQFAASIRQPRVPVRVVGTTIEVDIDSAA
jgi:nitrite reductase (NADH) small subunit